MSHNSRYWNWLKDITPVAEPLHWCHTTDGWHLRAVVETGELKPRPCPIFNRDLLYAFYGRPAYRIKSDESIGIAARAPVVLVLQPELIDQGTRLFPFDTGAFTTGLYARWIHSAARVDDFELPCDREAPRKHVSAFYNTSIDYLRLLPRPRAEKHAGEHEVDQIEYLITDRSAVPSDDRRLALELQLDVAIPITSAGVRAIVIPDQLREAPWLQAYLSGAGGVSVLDYPLSPNKRSMEYQTLIEDIVIQFQTK